MQQPDRPDGAHGHRQHGSDAKAIRSARFTGSDTAWNPTAAASGASTPPPTADAAGSGPKTSFGDGDWIPGKTIAAGTYYTKGGSNCYLERDSDLSGSSNSILANDNPVGQSIVTILPSDAEFKSNGCGTWKPLPTSGPQATTFGDGEYAIGINIAPGTYSAPGGANCYWEADSDFSQSGNSIVANDNPSGGVVVSISSPEVEFKVQGCGTWTKQ